MRCLVCGDIGRQEGCLTPETRHVFTEDGWGLGNKVWCDALHRKIIQPYEPMEQLERESFLSPSVLFQLHAVETEGMFSSDTVAAQESA